MITYRTDMMKDVRHLWPAMAWVQSAIPPVPYVGKLAQEAVRPLRCTSAWDEGRCVGTMMYWPAACLSEGIRIAKDIGDDPSRFIVRTNIYVHSEYQGQGISREMYRLQNLDAASRGHEASLGFGYETDEILSWALNIPGITSTLAHDKAGNPVVISLFQVNG